MTGEAFKSLDPDLLLEASRVMNAAGPEYAKATRLVSEWALRNLAKASPQTRAAILGDAAALRLREKGQFDDALDKLKQIDTLDCPDPDGRLHMLRALANGQKYADLKRKNETAQQTANPIPDPELEALRKAIRADLAVAFERDSTVKRDNVHYWKLPDSPPASRKESDVLEDDLRDVYADDPEFRKLVDTEDQRTG